MQFKSQSISPIPIVGAGEMQQPVLQLQAPNASKKWYAVRSGTSTGIFDDWSIVQSSVNGHPKNCYKKFANRSEAERFLANPTCITHGSRCFSPISVPSAAMPLPSNPEGVAINCCTSTQHPITNTHKSCYKAVVPDSLGHMDKESDIPSFGLTLDSYLVTHWEYSGMIKIKGAVNHQKTLRASISAILKLNLSGMDHQRAEWFCKELFLYRSQGGIEQ
ncbi:hypothetical protein FRC02_009026 [Tulasnella sp. 418]|nr:hypothetical protein FRC02_009026 [Tulasnella sp. 418]